MLVYVSKVILRCKVMGLTMISNNFRFSSATVNVDIWTCVEPPFQKHDYIYAKALKQRSHGIIFLFKMRIRNLKRPVSVLHRARK